MHPEPSKSISATSPGLFLAVEGPEGIGKSTLCRGLSERIERETGRTVVSLREPGGTELGERIRSVLLGDVNLDISRTSELFLYSASRAAMLEQVVRPALEAGKVVLTDRFALSTYAYQGGEGGLLDSDISRVLEVAVGELWPDITLVLNLEPTALWERLESRPGPKDRIEQEEDRLRSAMRRYRELTPKVPGARVISAAGSAEEMVDRAWEVVRDHVRTRSSPVLPTRSTVRR